MTYVPSSLVQTALSVLVAEVPELRAVYVFGSFASGRYRSDSDMDLAILTDRPLDVLPLWDLSASVASAIDRDVDLIDLRARNLSLVLGFEIVKEGKLIYCADEMALLDRKCYLIDMYHDFAIMRAQRDVWARERLKSDG